MSSFFCKAKPVSKSLFPLKSVVIIVSKTPSLLQIANAKSFRKSPATIILPLLRMVINFELNPTVTDGG